jgi:hypothetical protein
MRCPWRNKFGLSQDLVFYTPLVLTFEALHFRFLQSSGNPCPAPCAGQPSLPSYLRAVHLVGDILRAGPPADPDLHKHLLTRLIGITEIPEGAKALTPAMTVAIATTTQHDARPCVEWRNEQGGGGGPGTLIQNFGHSD